MHEQRGKRMLDETAASTPVSKRPVRASLRCDCVVRETEMERCVSSDDKWESGFDKR